MNPNAILAQIDRDVFAQECGECLIAMLSNPATYTTLLGLTHDKPLALSQVFAEQAVKQTLALHTAVDNTIAEWARSQVASRSAQVIDPTTPPAS